LQLKSLTYTRETEKKEFREKELLWASAGENQLRNWSESDAKGEGLLW